MSLSDAEEARRNVVEDILTRAGAERIRGVNNAMFGCLLAPFSRRHRSDKDKKPSMGVKVRSKGNCLVHCFTCKFGGTLTSLLQTLARHDRRCTELLAEAKSLENVTLDDLLDSVGVFGSAKEEIPEERTIGENSLAFLEYDEPFAVDYLRSRGISQETASAWGIGFDPGQRRVVIPVRQADGALVGAVGRAIGEGHKYHNYFNVNKRRDLLGIHLVPPGVSVAVVEGPIDALKTYQHLQTLREDYAVVSVLGSEISLEQADSVLKVAIEVVSLFDNDEPGKAAHSQLQRVLGRRLCVRRGVYEGSDPGELTEEALLHAVEEASVL